jgi:hypothetical protein
MIDKNIFATTFNDGFILSATKGRRDTTLIFKTNSLGNVLWAKYFLPICGGIQDLIQSKDSGFVIAANLKNYEPV